MLRAGGVRLRRRLRMAVGAAVLSMLATNAGVIGVLGTSVARADVPANGALFGVWAGLNPVGLATAGSDLGPTSYLPGLIKWQGRNNGVIQSFGNINDVSNMFGVPQDYPDDQRNAAPGYFPVIWNTWRSVPLYSIVNNQHTNQQVIQGANDAGIVRFGDRLSNFINGVGDTGIDEEGVAVPPGGRRIYLRLHIEPNSSVYPTYSPLSRVLARPAAEHTCAVLQEEEDAYIGAWRHIHDLVMYREPATRTNPRFTADQVQWIFNTLVLDGTQLSLADWDTVYKAPHELRNCPNAPGKSYGPSQIMESIYPGGDYADWVSMDGFHYVYASREPSWNGGTCQPAQTSPEHPTTGCGRDLPADKIFNSAPPADNGAFVAGMLDRVRAIAPGTPVAIDEVGASTMSRNNQNLKTPAEKSAWLRDFYSWVETESIRRVVWDNLNRGPTDWSIYAPDAPDSVQAVPPGPNDFVDYTMSRGDATDVYNLVTYNVYTGYKDGISDPYFVEPDPKAAGNTRLISDATFRGTWVTPSLRSRLLNPVF